jgi:hypothetical protein
MQNELRNEIEKGEIQVNIMAKVDRMNPNTTGEQISDALSALKGFAQSELNTPCSPVGWNESPTVQLSRKFSGILTRSVQQFQEKHHP